MNDLKTTQNPTQNQQDKPNWNKPTSTFIRQKRVIEATGINFI